MKRSIQITVDEPTLRALDATPEVKERGRSAVVREAIRRYLRDLHESIVDAGYREGYGGATGSNDVSEWQAEQAWPEEP